MSHYPLAAPFPVARAHKEYDVSSQADSSDDIVLFEQFLAGDDDAFLKLFRAYNGRLHLYCVKLIGSHVLAEDMMQELWERVIQLRRNPREVRNPLGFLLRMARNLCLDHLKSPKNRSVRLDDLHESAYPSERGEMSEMEELVLASLEDLPFDYREVLVLNMYCGYRYDEIAVMLGKSPDAIWARASRARTMLRKAVAASIGPRDVAARSSNEQASKQEGDR
jgi:RNA polymerase sigma-70 factor (ECF subfamily)